VRHFFFRLFSFGHIDWRLRLYWSNRSRITPAASDFSHFPRHCMINEQRRSWLTFSKFLILNAYFFFANYDQMTEERRFEPSQFAYYKVESAHPVTIGGGVGLTGLLNRGFSSYDCCILFNFVIISDNGIRNLLASNHKRSHLWFHLSLKFDGIEHCLFKRKKESKT